jgi:hypothetical protein
MEYLEALKYEDIRRYLNAAKFCGVTEKTVKCLYANVQEKILCVFPAS